MYSSDRISEVFKAAKQVPFDDRSRIVIMSDCHRGDGGWADNFAKNQNLFFTALLQYNYLNYTYIELGDGDDLWEEKDLSDTIEVYSNIFWLLSKFYSDNRLYIIYGNHDIVKGKNGIKESDFDRCFDVREKRCVSLFPGIEFHEGLILKNNETGNKIFLIHGHQGDLLNDSMWMLGRFLVRYLWKPLELIGINDPTSAAKNYQRRRRAEKRLVNWVLREKQMIIAGHTHRPVIPEFGEPLYFNDGSCVHPRCITAIEIVDGYILLVKWCYKTKLDGTVYVGREILVGPRKLQEYFDTEMNDEYSSLDWDWYKDYYEKNDTKPNDCSPCDTNSELSEDKT